MSASPVAAARAFGVVFAGSVAVDAIAAASLARTARALRAHRRPPAAAALGTLAVGAYVAARPLMERGHAIEIDAPPDAVWPWLAQIGQDRGGFYSYEWLENLAGCHMHNADEIHPEWQTRRVGEMVPLHPDNGLPVTRFEPGRAIGLKGWGTFELAPLPGGRTRMVVRGEPQGAAGRIFYELLVQIPHLVMERRMLVGIKQRAEAARVLEGAPNRKDVRRAPR